jgi:hypothetical protein
MLKSGKITGDQLPYWAKMTEAQILRVEARIEIAEGNDELAIAYQTKAALRFSPQTNCDILQPA